MKRVVVEVLWRTQHEFTVPDDWQMPLKLDDFTEGQLAEITSQNAELVDWGLTT